MKPVIIYPCEFGNLNKIDPDYQFEQEVALEQDFKTILINYDDFTSGQKLKVTLKGYGELAIYRGWMLKISDYSRFYSELLALGYKLMNSPKEYESTHYFVESYKFIEGVTPKILWYEEGKPIDWNEVRQKFDKFMVKDYVKSVKGFDFPEYLESSMTDEELNGYIDKFKSIRGDLYSGGIVLKQYVELARDGDDGHTHEYRAFYIEDKLATIYPNSNNEKDSIPHAITEWHPLRFLLKSNFYTIDFARLKNGEYTIIEIGDGQVSGIPSKKEAIALYKGLELEEKK